MITTFAAVLLATSPQARAPVCEDACIRVEATAASCVADPIPERRFVMAMEVVPGSEDVVFISDLDAHRYVKTRAQAFGDATPLVLPGVPREFLSKKRLVVDVGRHRTGSYELLQFELQGPPSIVASNLSLQEAAAAACDAPRRSVAMQAKHADFACVGGRFVAVERPIEVKEVNESVVRLWDNERWMDTGIRLSPTFSTSGKLEFARLLIDATTYESNKQALEKAGIPAAPAPPQPFRFWGCGPTICWVLTEDNDVLAFDTADAAAQWVRAARMRNAIVAGPPTFGASDRLYLFMHACHSAYRLTVLRKAESTSAPERSQLRDGGERQRLRTP